MRKLYKYALISLFIISCTKDVGFVYQGDYPTAIGSLITHNCAVPGCHNSSSYPAAAGLNLETWQSLFRGDNTGSPVIPFNSRFSSLCYFINTYDELGLKNQPTMPLNTTPLSSHDVKSIIDWINDGARDKSGNVMWADNLRRKKLYAVNQGCDVVTVFDSDTQLPMRYIDVGTKTGIGDTPHQIRVSPDGNYWYVVFINNNVMQKFRCSDDSYVGTIPLTPFAAGTSVNANDDALNWNTFVMSSDSKRAYCVSWTSNGSVAAVDLDKMKLIHYYPGFTNSHGIALNATEDKLYITSQLGNYIMEVDTGFSIKNDLSLQNGQAPSSASVLDPHDIILAPNKTDLLITCQRSNEIRVYNIPTHSVTQIIPTGVYPQEIVYSKSFDQFFISCTNDTTTFPNSHGVITRIAAAGYSATNLKCGYQPHGLAVDEQKKLLYVLSRNTSTSGQAPHHTSQCNGRNGFVNFVDLTTYTLLSKKYELSVDPYFIYARP